MTLIIAILGLCGLLALFGHALYRHNSAEPVVFTQNIPAISGAFRLIDTSGNIRTNADFRGQYMLIYFGFTYCPDICPLSLQVMSDALALLNASEAAQITPIFITVDPSRDTPDAMAAYIAHFHPQFVGLSGDAIQIAEAARNFKVFYQKISLDDTANYLVDHSSIYYLMDTDGAFIKHFNHAATPAIMAKALAAILAARR